MKKITIFAVLLFSFQMWAQEMPGAGGMNGNSQPPSHGGGANDGSGMNGGSGSGSGWPAASFVTYEMREQACAQFFPNNLSYQNGCLQQYSFSIIADSQYIVTLSWSGDIGGNQIQTCTVSVLKSPSPNAKFAIPPVSCQIYSQQPMPHW